jgi:hypothetical protein
MNSLRLVYQVLEVLGQLLASTLERRFEVEASHRVFQHQASPTVVYSNFSKYREV